jgi:hypothetical protein
MQAFRGILDDCNLHDLGFVGDSYTWKRGRIRERLDRVVANNAWNLLHPGVLVQHLGYIRSDHRPILLDTEAQQVQLNNHKGPRRFEAKWLREPQFREVVEHAWGEVGHQSGGVLGKLNKVHAIMHAWNDSVLKQPKKKIRQSQRELEKAMTGQITDESEARAKEMTNLIELLLEQEEIYWSQRSTANWI